jgi:TM2 domain-containing membrane protein YozV
MKSKGLCIILCLCGLVGLGGLHDFYLGRIGWRNCEATHIELLCDWYFMGFIKDLC